MHRRSVVAAVVALIVTGGGTLFSVWQTTGMQPPPIPIPAVWGLGGMITVVAVVGTFLGCAGGITGIVASAFYGKPRLLQRWRHRPTKPGSGQG
jgi:hypothetical protein